MKGKCPSIKQSTVGLQRLLRVGAFLYCNSPVTEAVLTAAFGDRRAVALARYLVKKGDFALQEGRFVRVTS